MTLRTVAALTVTSVADAKVFEATGAPSAR